MPTPFVPDPQRWTDLEATLHTWRQAHPDATWVEIEAELDRQLNGLRGEVVGDVAEEPGRCPHGGVLQGRGTHARTVLTEGAQAISLTRTYQTCPACGTGLFPP